MQKTRRSPKVSDMIKLSWNVEIADIISLIELAFIAVDLTYLTVVANGYRQMKKEQMRRDNVYNRL